MSSEWALEKGIQFYLKQMNVNLSMLYYVGWRTTWKWNVRKGNVQWMELKACSVLPKTWIKHESQTEHESENVLLQWLTYVLWHFQSETSSEWLRLILFETDEHESGNVLLRLFDVAYGSLQFEMKCSLSEAKFQIYPKQI